MQQRQKKLALSFDMGHNSINRTRKGKSNGRKRMIFMKKIVAVILVLTLALALSACNGGKKSASSSDLAAAPAAVAAEKL